MKMRANLACPTRRFVPGAKVNDIQFDFERGDWLLNCAAQFSVGIILNEIVLLLLPNISGDHCQKLKLDEGGH